MNEGSAQSMLFDESVVAAAVICKAFRMLAFFFVNYFAHAISRAEIG